MKSHPLFRICWYAADILLLGSLALVLYSVAWESSTRSYLKGFSDAVVPYQDSPEQKVEAILAWMKEGPTRRSTSDPDSLDPRDPHQTLNYRQLLQICGTATNAFVNLADSSGLRSRRLLLLDDHQQSKHVVAEVFLDGEWAVVDPTYRTIFRSSSGQFLTRTQLQDPDTFRKATLSIPDYPPSYTYERTVHVRLARIPLVGRYLRSSLNFIWPHWEERIDWTLLLERESFAVMTLTSLMLGFALALRLLLGWYGTRRLGVARIRLRDQFIRAGGQLLSSSK
jgi:Transglutaminase-like superfamily